jgi:hypothetical protein
MNEVDSDRVHPLERTIVRNNDNRIRAQWVRYLADLRSHSSFAQLRNLQISQRFVLQIRKQEA